MKAMVYKYGLLMLALFFLGGNLPETLGAEKADAKNAVEFKTVYPGIYDADEQELLNTTRSYLSGDSKVLMEKLAIQLAGGSKQIGDMKLNHALQPLKDYTPDAGTLAVSARRLYPLNPLYTNPEYAKKTRYKGLIAASITVQPGFGFAYIPKGTDIWVSSDDPAPGRGLDHELTFYRPIYPGDTLNGVVTEQSITDITDPQGSKVRSFRCIGKGEVYNQKGELVVGAFYSGIETFKIFRDRSMVKDYDRPLTIAVNKPEGYWDKLRDWHVYTDADWKYIKDLWSREEIRGARTLYWEDVKVGDEPTWTVDGPFLDGGRTTEHYAVREILMKNNADEIKDKLYKDAHGIYRLKDAGAIDAGGAPPGMQAGAPPGGQTGAPPAGQPGAAGGMQPGGQAAPASAASTDPKVRSSFQNTIGAQYATRVVTNWMGDDGWLYKFAWRLAFSLDSGSNQFPEEFDRPSYLYKVPSLKKQGKFMLTHGFDGDLAITKAYVCDKYIRDGRHYVDLVVWLETIDGQVWSECYAVVELPSKEDKK